MRKPAASDLHCGGLFFNFRRILKHPAVTFPIGLSVPQKLAQSNLHRKSVSKRFLKVQNFEFEFPTVFFGYILALDDNLEILNFQIFKQLLFRV